MNTVKNYSQRQSQRTSQRQNNNFDEFMSQDQNSQEPAPENDQPNIGNDSRISSSQSPHKNRNSSQSDPLVKQFETKPASCTSYFTTSSNRS